MKSIYENLSSDSLLENCWVHKLKTAAAFLKSQNMYKLKKQKSLEVALQLIPKNMSEIYAWRQKTAGDSPPYKIQ